MLLCLGLYEYLQWSWKLTEKTNLCSADGGESNASAARSLLENLVCLCAVILTSKSLEIFVGLLDG